MNKDETIKDILELISQTDDDCTNTHCKDCEFQRDDFKCFNVKRATALYNAGYRKMTAREIIEWECKHIKPQH